MKRKYCQDEISAGIKIPKNREAIFREYAYRALADHELFDAFDKKDDITVDELDKHLENINKETNFDENDDNFCIRKDFLEMSEEEIEERLEKCKFIPCEFCKGCVTE